jgi:hypothetical protein|tara:strand:- start:209 stop:571 length:363 start_codon:yes stop_codon:yes gene_type:complete
MGRPITKRFLGPVGVDAQPTIPARVKIGSNSAAEGHILTQRSSRKFKVKEGSNEGICTLVDKALGTLGNDEMNITGIVTNGGAVRLKKITRHLAVDYSNNRYTWSVEDDSTESILRLVAV